MKSTFSAAVRVLFCVVFALCLCARAQGADSKTVGVADFLGSVRQPGLQRAISQEIADTLAQHPGVTVISRGALIAALQQSGGANVTSANAAAIASAVGATAIVAGEVQQSSASITVIVRIFSATGKLIGSRSIAAGVQDLKNIPVQACESISQTIGLGKFDFAPGAGNLDTLSNFGKGLSLSDQGKYADAAREFSQASQGEESFKLSSMWLNQMSQTGLKSSQDPLERVRLLQLQGNTKEALEELEKARQSGVYGAAGQLLKAELLLKGGDANGAASELKTLLNSGSDDPQVYFNFGRVMRTLGKVDEAIIAFQKSSSLDPSDIDSLVNLAELYQLQGDFPKSAESFRQAGSILLNNSNFQGALVLIRRAKAIDPKSPVILAQEGAVLLELGVVSEAAVVFEQLRTIDPKNVDAMAGLGRVYFLQGDEGKAVTLLTEALAANPQDFSVNYYLGLAYAKNTKDKKLQRQALELLEKAVFLKPDHKDALLALARQYRALGMNDQAKDAYRKLRDQDVDNYLLSKEMADFMHNTGAYQEAEVLYSEAVRLNPDYLDAHEGLGEVYKKQGKDKELAAELERIRHIDPQAEFKNSVLNKQILALINTMPNSARTELGSKAIDKVAVIDVVVEKPTSFWQGVFRKLRLRVPNTNVFLPAVEQSLRARYSVKPHEDIRDQAKSSGFKAENFQSQAMMQGACRTFGLDAVFIVKIIELPKGEVVAGKEDTVPYKIALEMFEGLTPAYWGNGTVIDVPKKNFYQINWIPIALAVACLGACIALFSYVQSIGFGNATVQINYDKQQAAGYFSLKLSRKQNDPWATKISKTASGKFSKKASFLSKGEEYMVGDITEFKKFLAGKYYVYLFGNIADKNDRTKIVGTFSVSKPVTIKKGETAKVDFNLIENEAYVEVHVNFKDNLLINAEVICKETEAKATTKAEQGAMFYLKPGIYRLTAAYEDLRTSFELKVPDLNPLEVTIQMHEGNRFAAQGLNDQAAEIYLQNGDEIEAARLYERAGDIVKACRILGEKFIREENFDKALACYKRAEDFDSLGALYQRMGDMENAYRNFGLAYLQKGEFDDAVHMFNESKDYENLAKAYAGKGDAKSQNRALGQFHQGKGQDLEAAGAYERGEAFGEAGEAYSRVGNAVKAGEMFVKSQDFARAAESFMQAGDKKRAAMAYEKAGMSDKASQLYSSLGDTSKAPKVLLDAGRFMDAAKAYRASGLLDEALAALRQMKVTQPEFPDACELMATIFEEKGEVGLAVQAAQRGVENVAIDNNNLDRFYSLGQRQEKAGAIADAIRTYEKILSVNLDYKDLGHHLRELKDNQQARTVMGASSLISNTAATGAPAAATSRYDIIKEIGRGGMGIVFHAKDKLLEREVALKVLPDEIKNNPDALAAFLKEAKAAAKLTHQNLVTIFDTGQDGGNYFITMELVEGQTLKQLLQRSPKQLRAQDVVTVAVMICEGLSYAHKARIIHRDIKPSNIMINRNRQVKIMDFGLATVMQTAALDKTMMRGTPLYMAPEMIMGRGVDYRSDIYSMGITLYEMATKKVPFSSGDVAYHHLHTQPPQPTEFNAEVPPELAKIILKAIAKKQEERFQTMDELLAALQSLLTTLKSSATTQNPAPQTVA